MAIITCLKCGYGTIITLDEESYCNYCHSSYEEKVNNV